MKKAVVFLMMFFIQNAYAEFSADEICDRIADMDSTKTMVVVDAKSATGNVFANTINFIGKKLGELFHDDHPTGNEYVIGKTKSGVSYRLQKTNSYGRMVDTIENISSQNIAPGTVEVIAKDDGTFEEKTNSDPVHKNWGIKKLCLKGNCPYQEYSEESKSMVNKRAAKGQWYYIAAGIDGTIVKSGEVYGFIFPMEERDFPKLDCLP